MSTGRSSAIEHKPSGNARVALHGTQPSRIEALHRDRAFIADYVRARDAWREGRVVAFPACTYWLQRFANVTVAET